MHVTKQSQNINKVNISIALLLIILGIVWFWYGFNNGERVLRNDGLGWDGNNYAVWAQQDTVDLIVSKSIPGYYIGRLLPSFIIHYVCYLVGYDISTNIRIIHAFYIYNLIALSITGIYIVLIGRYLKWRFPIYLMSFIGIFINYQVLKNSIYNPTLVDISALTIGLATYYYYLSDKFKSLVIAILAGCFIWPTALYGGIILLIFPKIKMLSVNSYLNKWLVIFSIFSLYCYAFYLYKFQGLRLPEGTNPINKSLIFISLPLITIYLYFLLSKIFDIGNFLISLRRIKFKNSIIALLILLFLRAIYFLYSSDHPNPLPLSTYIGSIAQLSIVNPLINVVAHTMSFGPFFLLAFFLWKNVVEGVRKQGIGLVILFGFYGLLSIGSESRQLIIFWPILVIAVCEALNTKYSERIGNIFIFAILILGLILSRFWLPINVGVWTGNPLIFPDQMLFMHAGPWISNQMYSVFFVVSILSSLVIYLALKVMEIQAGLTPFSPRTKK